MNIHDPRGIGNGDPSNRAASDLRLRLARPPGSAHQVLAVFYISWRKNLTRDSVLNAANTQNSHTNNCQKYSEVL